MSFSNLGGPFSLGAPNFTPGTTGFTGGTPGYTRGTPGFTPGTPGFTPTPGFAGHAANFTPAPPGMPEPPTNFTAAPDGFPIPPLELSIVAPMPSFSPATPGIGQVNQGQGSVQGSDMASLLAALAIGAEPATPGSSPNPLAPGPASDAGSPGQGTIYLEITKVIPAPDGQAQPGPPSPGTQPTSDSIAGTLAPNTNSDAANRGLYADPGGGMQFTPSFDQYAKDRQVAATLPSADFYESGGRGYDPTGGTLPINPGSDSPNAIPEAGLYPNPVGGMQETPSYDPYAPPAATPPVIDLGETTIVGNPNAVFLADTLLPLSDASDSAIQLYDVISQINETSDPQTKMDLWNDVNTITQQINSEGGTEGAKNISGAIALSAALLVAPAATEAIAPVIGIEVVAGDSVGAMIAKSAAQGTLESIINTDLTTSIQPYWTDEGESQLEGLVLESSVQSEKSFFQGVLEGNEAAVSTLGWAGIALTAYNLFVEQNATSEGGAAAVPADPNEGHILPQY